MAFLDAFRVCLLYNVLDQILHQHAQSRFFLSGVVRAREICRADSRHAAKLIDCACVLSKLLHSMTDRVVSFPYSY
jgi:hypothetical protein